MIFIYFHTNIVNELELSQNYQQINLLGHRSIFERILQMFYYIEMYKDNYHLHSSQDMGTSCFLTENVC